MKSQVMLFLVSSFLILGCGSTRKTEGADNDFKLEITQPTISNIQVSDTTSLFDYIYKKEGIPKIKIDTDTKDLIANSEDEEYQSAYFELFDAQGNLEIGMESRIRARGNIRKVKSYFPPVKIDFSKKVLDSLGFERLDKLKFVFPKDSKKLSQMKLYKEFFLYDVYQVIAPYGIRAKLVEVSIFNDGKEKFSFTGFVIEDEKAYLLRTNAKMINRQHYKVVHLDREELNRMLFFQYMIANTDFSIYYLHNLEFVVMPGFQKEISVPYDFDYSGFVDQDYAFPNETLPIKSVHDRYFYPPYKMKASEFEKMVAYYLSKEQEIYNLFDEATYMNQRDRKDGKKYFENFFDLLRKPNSIRKAFVKG